jgi:hypothetical protein
MTASSWVEDIACPPTPDLFAAVEALGGGILARLRPRHRPVADVVFRRLAGVGAERFAVGV